jgi:hypothetical protein
MAIAEELTGGDPRSLGNADAIAQRVLGNREELDELFACLFADDVTVRMRAGDALEKVGRQRPEWLDPYVDRLLTEVVAIDQPSVQWHLAQILGELSLTADQRTRAIEHLKRNLEHATDWIVLNYTLEVFADFARQDPALRPYFHEQLIRQTSSRHKSVAKRAARLLQEL